MDSDSSSGSSCSELLDIDLNNPEDLARYFEPRERESPPLQIQAILLDDLENFEALIKSGESPNCTDRHGRTPLHVAIKKDRVKFFDFLLTLDTVRIDVQDYDGKTPLMLACSYRKYYVVELVKKGADIHAEDFNRQTPLHRAVENEDICLYLIQNGADVNVYDILGQTPLYYACREDLESMHLLLCCGADPHLVGDESDWAPLDIALFQKNENIAETLVLFGFDHLKVRVKLLTIRLALASKFACFWDILNSTSELIPFQPKNLREFANLSSFDPKQLLAFLNKFPSVGCQVLRYFNPLQLKFFDNETDYVDFVLGLNSKCLTVVIYQTSYFPYLWLDAHRFAFSENGLTIVYCLFLSHGLSLTSYDLDFVYHQFGFCNLFETLLHMKLERHHLRFSGDFWKACLVPKLIYDIRLNVMIEKYISIFSRAYGDDARLVNAMCHFFVRPCLTQRLQISPRVPSLLELSRNASRKFLIERYSIKDNVGFFTMLKSLCISQVYKDIICYKKRIYFLHK